MLHLQIPYLHKNWSLSTRNLPVQDLISDQAKVGFWQMQKLKISISKMKSHMLKKSIVFNFLLISQLIQKVLQSNLSKLVLNIHIYLYKNSKILFLHEKLSFKVKISTFFSLKNKQTIQTWVYEKHKSSIIQGYYEIFWHLKCGICESLLHVKKNCTVVFRFLKASTFFLA